MKKKWTFRKENSTWVSVKQYGPFKNLQRRFIMYLLAQLEMKLTRLSKVFSYSETYTREELRDFEARK